MSDQDGQDDAVSALGARLSALTDDHILLHQGDCRTVLAGMEPDSYRNHSEIFHFPSE
ncbi:MAG: hypothetical protein HC884_04510 [Chloroflexaceae bacterium]|nr:hypothetical protein [Chloroflexaceae bacterium]